jgi:foldase protein PrsA
MGATKGQQAAAASSDPSAIVATVDGMSITRGELDTKLAEVRKTLPANAVSQGQDASFELSVLNDMVNLKLLTEEATKEGYTVTDDEVNKQVDSLVQSLGGQEAFDAQLKAAGLTKDGLLQNKLVNAKTDASKVTVTDQEVKDMYDQAVASAPKGQQVPALADVSDMARAQLTQKKSADLINTYIDTLRKQAQINITL